MVLIIPRELGDTDMTLPAKLPHCWKHSWCWECSAIIMPRGFIQALKPEYADAAAELADAGIPVTLAKVT